MIGLAIVLDLNEVAAVVVRIEPLQLAGIPALTTLNRLLMVYEVVDPAAGGRRPGSGSV